MRRRRQAGRDSILLCGHRGTSGLILLCALDGTSQGLSQLLKGHQDCLRQELYGNERSQ